MTSYSHRDDNNLWKVKTAEEEDDARLPAAEPQLLYSGSVFKLEHVLYVDLHDIPVFIKQASAFLKHISKRDGDSHCASVPLTKRKCLQQLAEMARVQN